MNIYTLLPKTSDNKCYIYAVLLLTIAASCSDSEQQARHRSYGLISHQLTATISDPLASSSLSKHLALSEEPFDLFYAVGGNNNGMDEYHIVRVDPTGKCEYRFPKHAFDHKIEQMRIYFKLDNDEIKKLREVLSTSDYFNLPLSYQTNVCDGTIVLMRCYYSGRNKDVMCNNYFPQPILDIHNTIMDYIIANHKKDMEKAKRIPGNRSYLKDLMESVGNVPIEQNLSTVPVQRHNSGDTHNRH